MKPARACFVAGGLLLVPGVGGAERYGPSTDYFTGVYERIGRDDATPPGFINEFVWISPNATGGVTVAPCLADGGAPFDLEFFELFESTNLLSSGGDDHWMGCQFFNNMDNYPILTCFQGETGRFTLWPVQKPESCPAAKQP